MAHTRIGFLASLTSCFALAACTGPDVAEEPEVERTAQPVTVDNGLSLNGLGNNGLMVNGFALNGLSFNGIKHNGLSFNGLSFNGLSFNGLSFNGLSFNGLSFNGIGTNGVGVNGLSFNGLSFNGLSFNGLSFNGLSFNGVSLNGLSFNGLSFNGNPLSADEIATVDVMLYHLVGCALPSTRSVVVQYVDGTYKTYDGLRGFAPEWESAPISAEGEERVRACLESSTSAGLRIERTDIPLSAEQLARAKVLLRYLISCALSEGDSVSIDGEVYEGGLGLAPEWKDSAPTAAGERKVSACLAARANANGQTVSISLRGAGADVSVVEKSAYGWHEGGFWADLFGSDPYIRTCAVGGGISGRVCTKPGGCGFDDLGACADVCDSQDADDAYSSCGSENDPYVINTFLALGTTMAFYDDHGCFKNHDGEIWCWGHNSYGELGTGSASVWGETEPVPTVIPRKARSVAAGDSRNCAILDTGELWCWGQSYGATPAAIEALGPDVAQVSHGTAGACALKTDGSVWCWGEIGVAGGMASGIDYGSEPVHVMDGVGALASSGWTNHTCAIKHDGTAWCWGSNMYARVSMTATTLTVEEPVQGSGPDRIVTDVCAGEAHTCARLSDGTVDCWGNNGWYQLGTESIYCLNYYTCYPYNLVPISNVAEHGLACGANHTCAVKTDGTVECWGANDTGQLGDGSLVQRATPEPVLQGYFGLLLFDIVELIPGANTTCGRMWPGESGSVIGDMFCWGDNGGLRLGDPTFTDPYSVFAIQNTNVDGLPTCGDGVCDARESAATCDADCCDTEGATRSCGETDTGACQLGSQNCSGGTWSACAGEVGPSAESCGDGVDNDCDGNQDEDCADPCFAHAVDATGTALSDSCGTCAADVCAADDYCCTVYWDDVCVDRAAATASCCAPGDTDACGSNVGACSAGTTTCLASGDWDICVGEAGPSAETCNEIDDDCDGEVDEGVCGSVAPLYQPIATGSYSSGYSWNYNLGYRFTATDDLTVSALGGRFQGTKTVRLYDLATGAVLASASVSSSDDWSYTDIAPVTLTAGKSYSVAAYIGGSGGSAYLNATLPASAPGVSSIYSCYRYASTAEPCSYSGSVTTHMYGVADLKYEIGADGATEPPPGPANICDGTCGGRSTAGCWCDNLCDSYGDCCQDATGSKGYSQDYVCEACTGALSDCGW